MIARAVKAISNNITALGEASLERFSALSRSWKKVLCASAAAVFIPLMALPATALAATTKSASPQLIPTVSYKYRIVSKTSQGTHTGDWKVCGVGINDTSLTQVTFTCTETVTASTSLSLSGGYSPEEVSASIGFNIQVSYTFSRALGLAVGLPPHIEAQIQFGIYYTQYRGEMEKQTCVHTLITSCGPWEDGHWVTVQHAIAPAVRATGEKRYG
jgi:hypothetical protein